MEKIEPVLVALTSIEETYRTGSVSMMTLDFGAINIYEYYFYESGIYGWIFAIDGR